jgi:two-component system phosphate regulon response regulator PhoB
MRTVLVADDDEIFCELVCETLRQAGYQTLAASNGEAAWDILRSHSVDMAILDVEMPKMDGTELMKKIRRDARYRHIPILMLTIRSLVSDQISSYERGADDYLTKPFEEKMLLARLQVLERRILK